MQKHPDLEAPSLLLALQCWKGDQDQALELTKAICALDPEKCQHEFMISARRGCNQEGIEQIAMWARTKFAKVHVFYASGYSNGWPQGCNELWRETMQHACILKNRKESEASCVLTFESDCLPLARDWIDRLSKAWSQKARSTRVLGTFCRNPGQRIDLHINGNALFEIGLLLDYPVLIDQEPDAGWDYTHRKLLLRLGEHTELIAQKYQAPGLTLEEFEAYQSGGAVLLHGVKKGGLDLVRSQLVESQ